MSVVKPRPPVAPKYFYLAIYEIRRPATVSRINRPASQARAVKRVSYVKEQRSKSSVDYDDPYGLNDSPPEESVALPSLYAIESLVIQNPPSAMEGVATSPKYNHTVKSMQANRLVELQRRVKILRNNYDKINKKCEDMENEINNLTKQYNHMQETQKEVANDFNKLDSKKFNIENEIDKKTTMANEEIYNHQIYLHMKQRLDYEMDQLTQRGDYLQGEIEKGEIERTLLVNKVNLARKKQCQAESYRNKLLQQLEDGRKMRAGRVKELTLMNEKQIKARDDKIKRLGLVDEIANRTRKELLKAENGKRRRLKLTRTLFSHALLRKLEQEKRLNEPIVALFNELMNVTGSKYPADIVERFLAREDTLAGVRAAEEQLELKIKQMEQTKKELEVTITNLSHYTDDTYNPRKLYKMIDDKSIEAGTVTKKEEGAKDQTVKAMVIIDRIRSLVPKLLTVLDNKNYPSVIPEYELETCMKKIQNLVIFMLDTVMNTIQSKSFQFSDKYNNNNNNNNRLMEPQITIKVQEPSEPSNVLENITNNELNEEMDQPTIVRDNEEDNENDEEVTVETQTSTEFKERPRDGEPGSPLKIEQQQPEEEEIHKEFSFNDEFNENENKEKVNEGSTKSTFEDNFEEEEGEKQQQQQQQIPAEEPETKQEEEEEIAKIPLQIQPTEEDEEMQQPLKSPVLLPLNLKLIEKEMREESNCQVLATPGGHRYPKTEKTLFGTADPHEIKTIEEVIFQTSLVAHPDVTEKNVRVLPHVDSHNKTTMSPSIKATLDSTIQEDDEDDSIFLNRNETKKASHDFVNKEIKRQQRILKKLIEENAA